MESSASGRRAGRQLWDSSPIRRGEGIQANEKHHFPRPPTLHNVNLASKKRFVRRLVETPKETVDQLLFLIMTKMNPRGTGC